MSLTDNPSAPLFLAHDATSRPAPPNAAAPPTRRRFLCGAAVFGAAAIAGCGGSDATDGGTTTPTDNGAGSNGGAGAAEVAQLSDLPDGQAAILADAGLVALRTGESVSAWGINCSHQGRALNKAVGTVVLCPLHFSAFDLAAGAQPVTNPDTGEPGPATVPLVEVPVAVQGDAVVKA